MNANGKSLDDKINAFIESRELEKELNAYIKVYKQLRKFVEKKEWIFAPPVYGCRDRVLDCIYDNHNIKFINICNDTHINFNIRNNELMTVLYDYYKSKISEYIKDMNL